MITDLLLGWFVALVSPLLDAFPSFDPSGWPSLPPFLADYLTGFGALFVPGLVAVIAWRAVAYFLPGGPG